MFDNTANIFLSNYDVQLDDIVGAVCDISFDIGKQLEEFIEVHNTSNGFAIIDLFKEEFLQQISTIRIESLTDQIKDQDTIVGYNNQEFFSYIADHYNKTIFFDSEFLGALKGSNILLIDKEATTFLGVSDKAKDRLIPALKTAKILKKLISNLKSEKIQLSLQKIDTFENDFLYKNTIKTTKLEGQPLLPYLKLDFLNETLFESSKVDSGNYWINIDAYKSRGVNLDGVVEYSILTDCLDGKTIGLLIQDNLLPYANIDLVKYIKNEALYDYYWLLLKYTYTTNPPSSSVNTDESLKQFKELVIDQELNQLLSNLKNNFYIKDKNTINARFEKFFNEVVILEKLDFLDNYSFLMSPNYHDDTALGVYNSEKLGTSNHLLHWLNHKGEKKVNHFRSTVPVEIAKTIIHTLKPPICYYFIEKYFEDFFHHLLKANDYTFLANRTLLEKTKSFCEIDFLVKSKEKFYYFETKTKLSKFYIEDFLKKTSKLMDKFKSMTDMGIEIEYILVGGYSDNNVSDYQYFIKNEENKNGVIYNTQRAALNTKPYYFTVPVPDKEGKEITCIAEPEYVNLQNLVKNLCPK